MYTVHKFFILIADRLADRDTRGLQDFEPDLKQNPEQAALNSRSNFNAITPTTITTVIRGVVKYSERKGIASDVESEKGG